MADENVNVNVEFTGFKSQLREAQLNLEIVIQQFGESSEAAKDAAQSVALIRDQMDDARDAAKAFTGAGRFDAVTKSLSAVAGGFTAVQGAIGLVSKDNKALEQTMLKVQSAMALTQGLTALEDAGRSFKQLGQVAGDALKAIRTGIGATGIGLLVIALGTIVAYWDDIKAAVSGVSAEQEALNAETATNAALSQENLDALTASEQQLKLSGKSEEEIYQLKIKQYDTTIADAKAKQVADKATLDAQVAAAQRNKDILKGVLDFVSAPLLLVLETVDEIGLAFGKDFGLKEGFKDSVANLIFDPEEVKAEGEKTLKESAAAINKLEESRAGLINGYNDKAKAKRESEAAKRKEEQDKEDAEKLAKAKKHAEDMEKLALETNAKFEKYGKSAREKELLDIEQSYREKLKLAEGDIETTRQLNLLKDEQKKALEAKFAEEDKATAIKVAEDKKAAEDKELADLKASIDAKLAVRSAELDVVASIGGLISQIAGQNKSAQVAGLVIEQAAAVGKIIANTAAANASAVATSPITAGMPWVAINTATAGVSIASVIASVAKSIQQINSAGSSASGAGGAAGAPAASKFANGGMLQGPSHSMGGIKTAMGELEGGEFVINKRSTANFLPLIKAINDQASTNSNSSSGSVQTPIFKTYVVASEMTSTQEADKRVSDIARL